MLKKILAAGTLIFTITASYFYGLVSHKHYLPPFPQLLAAKYRLFPLSIGYSDTSSKTKVPCGSIAGGRTMVALALGQSNTGNHGETLYRPAGPVFNLFKGDCYRAEDPLLGPTGDGGSVWSRLADLVIQAGLYDRVVIIPIGVGTTTAAHWAEGGYLHPRVVNAAEEAGSLGLKITHVFWILGGSEKLTDGDAANRERYKKNFLSMVRGLRNRGVTAPVYVAIGTYSGAFNRDIQRAQRELAAENPGIVPGPNTDALHAVAENRWEMVHFTHLGLDRLARAWLAAIRRAENK
ncbi:MAG: hypothetical protein JW807_06315 [Spirochaetes bacterium]|nr:hypothetical protein [Spirochaetota bacterium]